MTLFHWLKLGKVILEALSNKDFIHFSLLNFYILEHDILNVAHLHII